MARNYRRSKLVFLFTTLFTLSHGSISFPGASFFTSGIFGGSKATEDPLKSADPIAASGSNPTGTYTTFEFGTGTGSGSATSQQTGGTSNVGQQSGGGSSQTTLPGSQQNFGASASPSLSLSSSQNAQSEQSLSSFSRPQLQPSHLQFGGSQLGQLQQQQQTFGQPPSQFGGQLSQSPQTFNFGAQNSLPSSFGGQQFVPSVPAFRGQFAQTSQFGGQPSALSSTQFGGQQSSLPGPQFGGQQPLPTRQVTSFGSQQSQQSGPSTSFGSQQSSAPSPSFGAQFTSPGQEPQNSAPQPRHPPTFFSFGTGTNPQKAPGQDNVFSATKIPQSPGVASNPNLSPPAATHPSGIISFNSGSTQPFLAAQSSNVNVNQFKPSGFTNSFDTGKYNEEHNWDNQYGSSNEGFGNKGKNTSKKGAFSWTSPEGQLYEVNYEANALHSTRSPGNFVGSPQQIPEVKPPPMTVTQFGTGVDSGSAFTSGLQSYQNQNQNPNPTQGPPTFTNTGVPSFSSNNLSSQQKKPHSRFPVF